MEQKYDTNELLHDDWKINDPRYKDREFEVEPPFCQVYL